VCQRWRYVVFDSPRRLDLQLLCTDRTPVTNMLDIWPGLPIVISAWSPSPGSGVTNIISALQQHNRVCKIHIWNAPSSLLKEFAAMQGPFPALTELSLSLAENPPVLPDSFLGRSAPRLRSLRRSGWIEFHFRDYRSYFCSPITLSLFAFGSFLVPDTFHRRRWSLPCPR
jgi:hypothetical protein